MRNAYLEALYDLAKTNTNIVAMVSDNGAIVYDHFRKECPKQFINVGIAEATLVSVAAGLADCGKIPFAYTIIPFLTMRAYEQVRNDVCMQSQNVKLVGVGAGIIYSTLGPTHHAIEDIAIMRVLPNMTIFSPASPIEAFKATIVASQVEGPVYIRLGGTKEQEIYGDDYEFIVGRGVTLVEGNDITVICTGSITVDVLEVSRELRKNDLNVRVINIHTIQPIDKDIIIKAARETKAIITVEEHSITGGLGSAVAEILMESGCKNILFKRMGLRDFCKGYGPHADLKGLNGLGVNNIKEEILLLVAQK